MRIITGSARGIRLSTLDGITTRPTPERVKEAVFSMIQNDIEGRSVYEPFGGSGQLSLEALSRGAARAMINDGSRDAIEIIKQNAQRTHLFSQCRVTCCDWKKSVSMLAGREKFDIVFIDPPYGDNVTAEVLSAIIEADLLNEGAAVIVERGDDELIEAEGLTVKRHNRYGKVFITLMYKNGFTSTEEL